ncbi:MAG: diacylglycerol kinase family protein [Flavobacterium sp.]|nr:diacylglycerol kinase family protein [Pedobacter sp.]
MRKFFKSFIYGIQGISYALGTQLNFKVHFIAAILVLVLGFFLNIDSREWLWIVLAISLVLFSELLNTALEVLVDLVSPDYHIKAKIVKDVAAGAVLVTALFAIITGLIIFIPRIF